MGANNYATLTWYGEMPSDRLVSGFLTINVRKKGAAEGAQPDDLKHDQRSKPTNWDHTSNLNQLPIDFAQQQAIGDYHCFLFWVVGAAHWHQHRTPTWANPSSLSPGQKRAVPDHPYCQSFVRAYPVALINPDTGTLLNHRVETVDGRTGVIISKLGNPSNGANIGYAGDGSVHDNTITGSDGESVTGFAEKWNWESIAAQFGVHNGIGSSYKQPTGTPHPNGLTAATGDNLTTNGNVMSGVPDLAFNRTTDGNTANNTGLMPNDGNGFHRLGLSEPDSSDDVFKDMGNDPTDDDYGQMRSSAQDRDKTLRPPVAKVLIEGYHRFDWSDNVGTSSFDITTHSPYSIKVLLKLWNDETDIEANQWNQVNMQGFAQDNDQLGSNDADGSANGSRNRNIQANISYMPFGETHKIKFTTSLPTGTTGG
tara:strand:+ start:639 stop:1910 length:1272 start_codon:yes stop_codon:yes gene_type:complete